MRKLIGKRQRRKNLAFYMFVMPAILGFLIFTLYPMIRSLWFSFTDASLLYLDEAEWVGFKNDYN